MKFSQTKPPIFDRLHKAFGVEWGKGLVIAYGDTIYHSKPLDSSVIAHERVHLMRQRQGVEQWWERYIRDKEFRFTEELLAYHAQYSFLRQTVRDRNELVRYLCRLAKDLASPMYGNIVDQAEARRLISMK